MSIRKRFRILTVFGMLASLGLGVPSTSPAQAKFELTPFVGSFYPLAKMCTDCFNDGSGFKARLVNSAAVGGRLTYFISNSIGFEGSFAYAPSRIELFVDSAGFAAAFSASGNVLLASGRLLVRPARTNLRFIFGGGIVKRGGDEWKNSGANLTSPAGIFGVSVRAAVTPTFALNISAEGNFYSFDPQVDPNNGSKFQSDVLVSVGVPISLSR